MTTIILPRLAIATRNHGKLREFKRLLDGALVEAAHPFEVDQREMESRGSAIDFGRSASLFPWHRDFTSAARIGSVQMGVAEIDTIGECLSHIG